MSNGSSHGSGNEVGSTVEPCPPEIPELTMHVDADRDGTADDDITGLDDWTWGANQKGAIVQVNNDDDNSNGRVDYRNRTVEGSDDESDLAPLLIKRNPPGLQFPAGWKARLSVSDRQKIRIFKNDGGSWSEFIGTRTPGGRKVITDLSPQRMEFGMEALQYPGQWPDRRFDGLIRLTLKVLDDTDSVRTTQHAKVRVAPWLMPNHLDQTEEVYVVETRDNAGVRNELRTSLQAAGPPTLTILSRRPHGADRWIQDAMEIGFSSMPKTLGQEQWHLPAVIPSARKQNQGQLHRYPKRHMLGPNFGYAVPKVPTISCSTLDSFGNLECTPPVSVNGREYKFGRIIYGHDSARRMKSAVRIFLNKQKVQEPFHIDTRWLAVGHVDEIYSICPWSNTDKKFKVIIASPVSALDILTTLRDVGQGDAPLFEGINRRLGYRLRTIDAILNDLAFVRMNRRVQRKIDRVEQKLRQELGLLDGDIVKFPVIFSWYVERTNERYCDGTLEINFHPDGSSEELCRGTWRRRYRIYPREHVAYTGNSVNMLVATKSDDTARLVIPKPFGPIVNNTCQFEEEIECQLIGSGNTHSFIDCFVSYHHRGGEIHCGTNSKRIPPTDRWWWEQEGIT